jgi:hypothetical protein
MTFLQLWVLKRVIFLASIDLKKFAEVVELVDTPS